MVSNNENPNITNNSSISTNKKKPTIAYIAPHVGDIGIGRELFSGIVRKSHEYDVNLLCIVGNELNKKNLCISTEKQYNFSLKSQCDGVLIWSGGLNKDITEEQIKKYIEHIDLPCVSIGNIIDDIVSIVQGDEAGIHEVVKHLATEHKFKKIAFIRGQNYHRSAMLRYEAYKKALEEYSIPFDENLISPPGEFSVEYGHEAIRYFLDEKKLSIENKDIEAIVTPSDLHALGAIKELIARGYKVPQDIAVTGFNNSEISKSVQPSITSVETHFYNIGAKAFDLLINILNGKQVDLKNIIPVNLVIRTSCCQNTDLFNIYKTRFLFGSKKSLVDKDNNIDIFDEKCNELIENLNSSFRFSGFITKPNMFKEMIDNFVSDVNWRSSDSFINYLEDILNNMLSMEQNVTLYHEIINEIRRSLMPCFKDKEHIVRADKILNRATNIIHKCGETYYSNKRVQTQYLLSLVYEASEYISISDDLDELLNRLSKKLPHFGIESSSIVLFDENDTSCSEGNLIFSKVKNKRIMFPEGSKKIKIINLLDNIISSNHNERFSYILLPLYFHNKSLGFVSFDISTREGSIYHLLASNIASAISGYLMISKLKQKEDNNGATK